MKISHKNFAFTFLVISFGFFSTIFAQSWNQLHFDPCQSLVIDSNDIFYSINNFGITKSYDNGSIWEELSNFNFEPYGSIAVGSKLFVSATHTDVFSSIDQGETWQSAFGGGFGCRAPKMIYLDNVDEILMSYSGYLRGVYRSNSFSTDSISWGYHFNPTGDCFDLSISNNGDTVYSVFSMACLARSSRLPSVIFHTRSPY